MSSTQSSGSKFFSGLIEGLFTIATSIQIERDDNNNLRLVVQLKDGMNNGPKKEDTQKVK